MKNKKLTLSILPEKLGICHFDKNSPIPDWANPPSPAPFIKRARFGRAKDISFCSITRTKDELSIVYPQDKIPAGVLAEKNWRAFKVEGPLGFSLTGIVASLSKPLAEAKISIFYISTYETDYILVEEKNFNRTKKILSAFCSIKK